MSLLPPPQPPQDDDPIITQFIPGYSQWELNDKNIKRIDPETGKTILHNYCEKINFTPLGVYRYLVETKGCDINVVDRHRNTPLHGAIGYFTSNNDITVLHYLLGRKDVNVNIKGQHGYTLLHVACNNLISLPLETFRLLIETMVFDINAQDNDNNTPLHCALRQFYRNRPDVTVLRYLLTHKNVNINIKGKYGNTLLHAACLKINYLPLDMFKLLVEVLGCDVNARDDYGYTPIHIILEQFNPADANDISALMYLLTHQDVNGNVSNEFGSNLLHIACGNVNILPLDVFKFLIETKCCDVNGLDDDYNTPIQVALQKIEPKRGDVKVVTYLLTQKSVNINVIDEMGHNLLHLACINDLLDSRYSVELNSKADASLCQIVEVIAERCLQQIVDETTP